MPCSVPLRVPSSIASSGCTSNREAGIRLCVIVARKGVAVHREYGPFGGATRCAAAENDPKGLCTSRSSGLTLQTQRTFGCPGLRQVLSSLRSLSAQRSAFSARLIYEVNAWKEVGSVKRQSLMLVVIGVVLFIAGGGIAFVTVNNSAKKNAASTTVAPPVSTPAVVATQDVPAGTTGQDMVSRGLVSVQLVPQKKYLATDLPNLTGLNDQVLTTALVKGEAVQSTELIPSTSSISIPTGQDAVSITTTGVSGLAGYLQPGSSVDVYANINRLSTTPTGGPVPAAALPCTELTMSNIEVLDVSQVVPTLNTSTASTTATTTAAAAAAAPPARTIPPTLTLLLSVTPAQAQEITFMTQTRHCPSPRRKRVRRLLR
jgi:Flp pilus assembly protein CpaB